MPTKSTNSNPTRLRNPLALASGVLKDCTPVETIHAVATTGWDMVGLWVDPTTWTPTTTTDVLAALKETGLSVLDIEVLRIKPGALTSDAFRILDVGIAVGAANVLIITEDGDVNATAAKMRELCRYVEDKGSKMRVNIEFGYFCKGCCKSLSNAMEILDLVAHPLAAILVDTLHLYRSGSLPRDIASIPRERISYAQICDAVSNEQGPDVRDTAAVLKEAVADRLMLGEGALDVRAMVEALPEGTPLSNETRSKVVNERWSDPVERSTAVREATVRVLV